MSINFMLDHLQKSDPTLYSSYSKELDRQQHTIELIASENIVSRSVLALQGSILTNKYAEGYPAARYYGGCDFVDEVENLAIERVKKLFNAEHANVQAHSGSQANMAAFMALLNPGDKILGMELNSGGHLTHGFNLNFSGKYYEAHSYCVNKKSLQLDYDEIRQRALEIRPKLIIAGASAYSRTIDFEAFRKICDEVGSYFLADIAHIAGLVATGLHPSPIPYADVVTSTTHKTLRGPRGGLILCKKEFAKAINKSLFPGIQGGPLMHVIAAKAIAFQEALEPSFKEYQKQVLKNAKSMVKTFRAMNYNIVSGDTDNHLLVLDLQKNKKNGAELSKILDSVNITVNKNSIPFDPAPPMTPSGIRIGSAAITSRGMSEKESEQVCKWIGSLIENENNTALCEEIKKDVISLCKQFPIYS